MIKNNQITIYTVFNNYQQIAFYLYKILDELKTYKLFLSVFIDIEEKLEKICRSLNLILKMFERIRSQLVRDQLNFYSAEVDKILKQMSDHFTLHSELIENLPAIVSSDYALIAVRNTTHLANINLFTWSLNILSSPDMKPKESLEESWVKFLLKISSEF